MCSHIRRTTHMHTCLKVLHVLTHTLACTHVSKGSTSTHMHPCFPGSCVHSHMCTGLHTCIHVSRGLACTHLYKAYTHAPTFPRVLWCALTLVHRITYMHACFPGSCMPLGRCSSPVAPLRLTSTGSCLLFKHRNHSPDSAGGFKGLINVCRGLGHPGASLIGRMKVWGAQCPTRRETNVPIGVVAAPFKSLQVRRRR